jgi:hypothetical protein
LPVLFFVPLFERGTVLSTATMRTRTTQAALIAAIAVLVSVLVFTGVGAAALTTYSIGGYSDRQYFATNDQPYLVPSTTWVNVPGMVATVTVPAGTRRLLLRPGNLHPRYEYGRALSAVRDGLRLRLGLDRQLGGSRTRTRYAILPECGHVHRASAGSAGRYGVNVPAGRHAPHCRSGTPVGS